MQVSALEKEILEVDPDTKEMLKYLVNKLVIVLMLVFVPMNN